MQKVIIALFILFSVSLSTAQELPETLFGPEWTFSGEALFAKSSKLESNNEELQAQNKRKLITHWLGKIQQLCPECKITGKRVTLPSGYWFTLIDDALVVEVVAKPSTLTENINHKDILQSLIWDTAKSIGLTPQDRLGGGHIHMDRMSSFGENLMAFRNFLVEIFNTPELFMGGFSLNHLNAPPLALLGETSIEGFRLNLQNFDSGQISYQDFIDGIKSTYLESSLGITRRKVEKYNAVSFNLSQTYELRGHRPQLSMAHYIAMLELWQAQIHRHLSMSEHTQIAFKPKNLKDKMSATINKQMYKYTQDIDPIEIKKATDKYIESSGLNPENYQRYYTEELKRDLKKSGYNTCPMYL